MKTVKAKKAALIDQDAQDDNLSVAGQTKGGAHPQNLPHDQNQEDDDINSRQNTQGNTHQIKKDSKIIETGEQIVVQPTEGK